MANILIELPKNRDYTGVITLVSDGGKVLAGPFQVCARASSVAAREHGNSNRDPLLPYGDTPLHEYRIHTILETGGTSGYDPVVYGTSGIVVLDGIGGEAALAEAAGRFHVFIQGGQLGPGKRLATTNGCLRMADADLGRLIDGMRGHVVSTARCVETDVAEAASEVVDLPYDEGDPPPLHARDARHAAVSPGRRDFMFRLGASAAALTFAGPLFVASTWSAEPVYAAAYDYSLKPGVTVSEDLEADVEAISSEYHDETGAKIVVTDGTRLPEDQASAMFNKLQKGEDLNKLYLNKPALKEILDAYQKGKNAGQGSDQIKEAMSDVIEGQVEKGVYISKHLRDNAFDVRSRNMTPEQIAEFKKAATDHGYKVVTEGDHLHVQEK